MLSGKPAPYIKEFTHMNLRDFLEIVSAVLGLLSGGYFSVGVLKLKTDTIPLVAMLSGSEFVAEELAKQKADFAFGSLFLALAFIVQISTKVFPAAVSIAVTGEFICGVIGSFSIAVLLWIASYFLHRRFQEKLVQTEKDCIVQRGK